MTDRDRAARGRHSVIRHVRHGGGALASAKARKLASPMRRRAALEALAGGMTLPEAADSAGVSVATLQREIRRNPMFAHAVRTLRTRNAPPITQPAPEPVSARFSLVPPSIVLGGELVIAMVAAGIHPLISATLVGGGALATWRLARRWLARGPATDAVSPPTATGPNAAQPAVAARRAARRDLSWLRETIGPISDEQVDSLRRRHQ